MTSKSDALRLEADALDAQATEADRVRADYREYAKQFRWEQTLFPHQFDAAMFGAEAGRWILGDEVGLGKTLTSIAWLDFVQAERVIYVTEAALCGQVAGEFTEFAPHRQVYNLARKTPKARAEIMQKVWLTGRGVLVVNYEIWRRDRALLESMVKWQADSVIVDEAHNIKHAATANYTSVSALISLENKCPKCAMPMFGLMMPKEPGQTRRKSAVCVCGWRREHGWGDGMSGFQKWQSVRSVANVLCMTGTPLLNSPIDIYPLLHQIDATEFPTEVDFKARYAQQNIGGGTWVFHAAGVKILRRKIHGLFLARTKESAGIKLPEQTIRHEVLEFEPTKYMKQQRLIKQISEVATVMLSSGETATIMHMVALITRKRQSNVWPGGIRIVEPGTGKVLVDVGQEITESLKMDTIIDDIVSRKGVRQVVFSQFSSAVDELASRLEAKGLRVAKLTGATSPGLREQIKHDFYKQVTGYKWDVLVGNYKVAATGLNLVQAKVMHILDEEWNPGKREQAYGRINRLGQTSETTVIVWRIAGTIDTWLANILTRKERMLKQFDKAKPEDYTDRDVEITSGELLEALKSGEIL